MNIKNTIAKYIPQSLMLHRRQVLDGWKIKRAHARYNKLLPKLREHAYKSKIRVAFFAIIDDAWKVDRLFQLLLSDSRFEVFIVVVPIVNYDKESMIKNLRKTFNTLNDKNYPVIMSYDHKSDKYLDVKKELKPDVIFFLNPYKGLVHKKFYYNNFKNYLSCYIDYGFTISKSYHFCFDNLLQNAVWRFYTESKAFDDIFRMNSMCGGKNTKYLGFPGIDPLISSNNISNPWKIKDPNIKRIIWAPHHTICSYNPILNRSSFLMYCDFMLEIAHKYAAQIQIAFKPHPILQDRLNLEWGKEKTEAYYKQWDEMPNGQYVSGDYTDLFLTSDAIMHDSGSFILEYLVTKKPAMYLHNGEPLERDLNEIAVRAINECYCVGHNKADIETFIKSVIEGKDIKKKIKEQFVNENLLPPNGKTASQNIYEDLCHEFFGSN